MQGAYQNYFKMAWNDVRSSPGWLGKTALLALVLMIPVFGAIVFYGYAYGWARDAAWGVRAPLPQRVFGNEDGRLYSRGASVFVLFLVCSLASLLVSGAFSMITGTHGLFHFAGHGFFWPLAMFMGVIGLATWVLSIVLTFAIMLFAWVGAIRIGIYDRLSAGFQFSKVWAMVRHDFRGLIGILGWTIVANLVWTAVVVLASVVVFLGFVAAGVVMTGGNLQIASLGGGAIALILTSIGLALVLLIGLAYLALVGSTAIGLSVVRAVGLWTLQFDVPHWRGQDDPMPCELQGQ